jgi:hypothetical protein
VTEPTPALRLETSALLFPPNPMQRPLRHDRYFQIGQFLIVAHADRWLRVGGQEDYEDMLRWGQRPRLLTGDPLPHPFRFSVQEDDQIVRMTYARLLDAVEQSVHLFAGLADPGPDLRVLAEEEEEEFS